MGKYKVYYVEEHTGGREGIGQGPEQGTYDNKTDAMRAVCRAIARGNTASIIGRDAEGFGRLLKLALVPW